jgi:hypothetical protein
MSTSELLRAVALWGEAHYPGVPLAAISLHFHGLIQAVQLPVPPQLAASLPPAEPEPGRPISPCVVDILDVLQAAGVPLTTTRLLAELAKAGKEWSERTVKGYLAEMVKDGTLTNPEGVTPRGYRLPA